MQVTGGNGHVRSSALESILGLSICASLVRFCDRSSTEAVHNASMSGERLVSLRFGPCVASFLDPTDFLSTSAATSYVHMSIRLALLGTSRSIWCCSAEERCTEFGSATATVRWKSRLARFICGTRVRRLYRELPQDEEDERRRQ